MEKESLRIIISCLNIFILIVYSLYGGYLVTYYHRHKSDFYIKARGIYMLLFYGYSSLIVVFLLMFDVQWSYLPCVLMHLVGILAPCVLMSPIIIRALRVIIIYEDIKILLPYIKNRNVTIGIIIFSLGVGLSGVLANQSMDQRNGYGNCILFYHFEYLLSVFSLFLLLMCLISYRMYSIQDTYRVSVELFGHLVLGLIAGLVFLVLFLLNYINYIDISSVTRVIRPHYYITLYCISGMYLSFIHPMRNKFYTQLDLIESVSESPIDDGRQSSDDRGVRASLMNFAASSILASISGRGSSSLSHSGSTLPPSMTSSNPILTPAPSIPLTTNHIHTHNINTSSISNHLNNNNNTNNTDNNNNNNRQACFVIESISRLSYSELLNTDVNDLLSNTESRNALQMVARNALCPELISFLLDVQSYQNCIDITLSTNITTNNNNNNNNNTNNNNTNNNKIITGVPSSSITTTNIIENSNTSNRSGFDNRSQSVSILQRPSLIEDTISSLPSQSNQIEPTPRTTRSNSFLSIFAPFTNLTSRTSQTYNHDLSHPIHSTSFSHDISNHMQPSSSSSLSPPLIVASTTATTTGVIVATSNNTNINSNNLSNSQALVGMMSFEKEVIYKKYLKIITNYIDYNASEEVNISMNARQTAYELYLKKNFYDSNNEKIRSVFDVCVREVHGVIRNNLYGDFKRYMTNVSHNSTITNGTLKNV